MSTYEPCVLGSDGNCTRWSHDHAAGRPSVTDNARAETGWIEWAQNLTGAYVTTTEEARQQIEGLVSGLTELAGLTSRAAGRAETTTATTEDAARVINEVLGGGMDNHARIAAHRLADAGLLATARTATTEDAEEVLHGAGWFARADLDPRDLRGILHDLADADLLRGGA